MGQEIEGFGLDRIGQIGIVVKDTDRAVEFYRDTLGLQFLFRFGSLAFFECGGVRLMLSPPEGTEPYHAASVLYYQVADLQRAVATLRSRGVTFEDEPHLIVRMPDHELWMTFFRDSEDNLLSLMAEQPLT